MRFPRLLIKNISWAVTSEELAQAFSKFGRVMVAKVKFRKSGLSSSDGYVDFATLDEAMRAFHGTRPVLEGKKLGVHQCEDRMS